MTAKIQHVIFNEWLPVVIGCEQMARYDLQPKRVGYYMDYDSTCGIYFLTYLVKIYFRCRNYSGISYGRFSIWTHSYKRQFSAYE